MVKQLANPTSIHEDLGSIPGLTQWIKDLTFAVSCGVGHRWGSDTKSLWLWRRLAATTPTGPLVWEPSHTTGAALKDKKDQKKKRSGINANNILLNIFKNVIIRSVRSENKVISETFYIFFLLSPWNSVYILH